MIDNPDLRTKKAVVRAHFAKNTNVLGVGTFLDKHICSDLVVFLNAADYILVHSVKEIKGIPIQYYLLGKD